MQSWSSLFCGSGRDGLLWLASLGLPTREFLTCQKYSSRDRVEAIENKSRISRVEVGSVEKVESVEKLSCRDLPISGLKYLPIRTRSARYQFDHYPMLTWSTRFILKPMSRSRRSLYNRTRSLPHPYPISLDFTRLLPDRARSLLEHTRSLLVCTRSIPDLTQAHWTWIRSFKKGAKIKPSLISRLVLGVEIE